MYRSSRGFGTVLALAAVAAAICVSGGPAYGAGVQVSLSSKFNADPVLRYSGAFTTPTATWDYPSVACPTSNDNWMLTQSAASQLATSQGLTNPAPLGINDNGFYPASGARLYDVQLGFTNTTPTGTNVAFQSNTNGSFSFNVPSNYYSQFAIFGSGGSGSAPLTITLTYASGSPTVLSGVTLPDWYGGNPGNTAASAAGTAFALTGPMSRELACQYPGGGYQVPNVSSNGAYIYGINLGPDSTRQLTSVTVAYAPAQPNPYTNVNFLTAAGALAATASVPALSALGLALLAMGLSFVCWLSLRDRRKEV